MMPELLEDWRAVGQLTLLYQCGKAVELKRLGCCRPYYDRRQHSLRFFGGLRERVRWVKFQAATLRQFPTGGNKRAR